MKKRRPVTRATRSKVLIGFGPERIRVAIPKLKLSTRAGKLYYITVNRGVIDGNRKWGLNNPPLRVVLGRSGRPKYGHIVEVEGPSRFVYRPTSPMPHGARLWVETLGPVTVG